MLKGNYQHRAGAMAATFDGCPVSRLCFLGYGMSDGLGGRGTIADCGYKLPH